MGIGVFVDRVELHKELFSEVKKKFQIWKNLKRTRDKKYNDMIYDVLLKCSKTF